jgi:uncharacterized protein (TIGR02996 family)
MPEPALTAEEAALVQALAAAPDDDVLRGVYADWLEEHGQAERARLMRLMPHGRWLQRLCDVARAWVEQPLAGGAPPTLGYVDLLFSFGLARLGQADASRALLDRARAALAGVDKAHTHLFNAFAYRIEQALEGKPPTGPLPRQQLDSLEHMDRMPRFVIDSMRQHSRVLEPDSRIEPYRHWGARLSGLDRELALLADVHDPAAVAERVRALLRACGDTPRGRQDRARVLTAGLHEAARVSEGFACELVDEAARVWDALPQARDTQASSAQARLLERALLVAARFDRAEALRLLVGRSRALLRGLEGEAAVVAVEALAAPCLRGLLRLGLRDEADALLTRMADLALNTTALRSAVEASPPSLLS